MRYGIFLFVITLLGSAACGRQTPTAPSVAPDALPAFGSAAAADTASAANVRSLTGRVTNALSGAGAAGVALRIAGLGDAVADVNGDFTLASEAADGRYRITVSGAG